MAVLKDLIVHGNSRFINGAQFNSIGANKISAEEGIFNKLVATNLEATEASITNLTATNAKVMGLLDVQGEMHTKSWTNANISNVGGSFYISPTVSTVIASNATPMSITIGGSANARTFAVSGGAFVTDAVKIYSGSSTTTASWAVGSHVMVTGNIRLNTTGVDYPLGTLTGYLTGALAAGGFTVGEISSPALETIIAELGTSNLKSYEIKISMFEIGPKASIKPVGIMMTSYGVDKSTYIDIYGGVNVKNSSNVTTPNVRIGYLGGLPSYTDSNNVSRQPVGWGIYTDNGYFKGVIVANAGTIGKFTITNDLYSGNLAATNSVWMSPGTSSSASIGGSSSISGWAFTASNTFGVTKTGHLWANQAHIIGSIDATSFQARDNSNNIRAIVDSDGLTVKDASGNMVAAFSGTGVNFSSSVSQKIGGTSNYIEFNPTTNQINIIGSGVYIGTTPVEDIPGSISTAQITADNAETYASEAINQASDAQQQAAEAQDSVSELEAIIGASTWATSHGIFNKSTDTTVDTTKDYYTVSARAVSNPTGNPHKGLYYELSNSKYVLTSDNAIVSGKTYYILTPTLVASPTGNPSTSGYYELSLSESVEDYLNAHINMGADGLDVTDGSASKVQISSTGVSIWNGDTRVASYGASAIIGDENGFHIQIGGTNNEIGFYEGSAKAAYISGDALYVRNSLSFGTPQSAFIFLQRQNGHFTLKKV